MVCRLFTSAALALLLMIAAASSVFAAAPALRDEINLAGTWAQGGTVPEYREGSSFTTKTFQRSITIPASWTGKRIFVEIETLNWTDVTSIDNIEVGRSTGGWLSHSYDITDHVTPGQTHTLAMIAGGTIPAGWPHSFSHNWAGLIYDVYLRAYGQVAIRDAEVITSVKDLTITVKYEMQNFGTSARTVLVGSQIYPSEGGGAVLSLDAGNVTLAGGEKKVVQASSGWASPNLWWPQDPKLYHLCSAVKESGSTIDSQTVRFGFRECKIEGRFIRLNGVRVNFRGESIDMARAGSYPANQDQMRARVNFEKSLNANSIRCHGKPAPNLLIDVCDEMGLLIEYETAYYQQGGDCANNQIRNIWLPAFVKHHRNHASIVQWSAQNESAPSSMTAQAMNQLIHAFDGNNRPVWHEEMESTGLLAGLETENIHYPEGYETVPAPGSVYSTKWIVANVPMGFGEMLACCWVGGIQPDIYYWQGVKSRGIRYNDVTLIHNYCYDPWAKNTANAKAIDLLTKSYAPVALFDSTYDGLGIAPIINNSYPSVAAGSDENRVLALYNDEFSDKAVTVQVDISSGGAVRASGAKTYQVEPGYHARIPCGFQVPYVGGSTFDLVLTTKKGGVVKFTEAKRFTVTGASSGTSANSVTLGDGVVRVAKAAPNADKRIGPPGISMAGGRLKVSGTARIYDIQGKPVSTIAGGVMVRMPAGIYTARTNSGKCARMVIAR
jgi:hypothetical protein